MFAGNHSLLEMVLSSLMVNLVRLSSALAKIHEVLSVRIEIRPVILLGNNQLQTDADHHPNLGSRHAPMPLRRGPPQPVRHRFDGVRPRDAASLRGLQEQHQSGDFSSGFLRRTLALSKMFSSIKIRDWRKPLWAFQTKIESLTQNSIVD
jgi:hypothetical protein